MRAVVRKAAIAALGLLMLIAGWVAIAPSASAQAPAGPRFGANYLLPPQSPVRGRDVPGLAVNPANANHIVEAEADPVNLQCDYNVSFDGGVTWTGGHLTIRNSGEDPPFPTPACDQNFDSGGYAHFNTGIVFGSGQNVYITFSAHRGGFNRPESNRDAGAGDDSVVARSTDGGRTFEPAVVAVPGGGPVLPDQLGLAGVGMRPQIAVERGAGANGADRLYVSSWNCFIRIRASQTRRGGCSAGGGDRRLWVARSDDGGVTWAPPVLASRANVRTGAAIAEAGSADEQIVEPSQPVIGPDGAVYVAYKNRDITNGTTCPVNPNIPATAPGGFPSNQAFCVVVTKSTDQGRTWQQTSTNQPVSNRTLINPRLAIDPSTSATGTLYVVYQRLVAPPDDTDISLQSSTDGGVTWSAPVRVNDDTAGSIQTNPNVSVGPGGRVNVIWGDRRHSYARPGSYGDIYYASSTTGGATAESFTPNRRVTDRTINLDVGRANELGSTLTPGFSWYGPVATPLPDGRLLAAWWDSREGNVDNGIQDIFLSRLDPEAALGTSVIATATPPGLSVRLSRLAYPGGTEGVGGAGGEPVTRVVVANDGDVAAALAGAVLARAHLGPLLLSPAGGLPAVVKAESARLRPVGAYVLGDSESLSAAVATDLRETTRAGENVVRLAAPSNLAVRDRPAELARRVAEQLAPLTAPFEAVIADPLSPEAGSASALAAALRLPILFVDAERIPAPTSAAISSLGIERALIVGGAAAVGPAVEAQLATSLGGAANVRRLGGADRYETSQAVLLESRARGLPANVVYVADGERPVDAAVLGAAVGRLNGLMLLAPSASAAAAEARLFGLGLTPMVDRLVTAVGTGGTDPAAPEPVAGPAPTPPPLIGGPTPIQVVPGASRAGRVLELNASRNSVRGGTAVRMRGRIGATLYPAGCQARQPVELQQRVNRSQGFRTLVRTTSDQNGSFTVTIRPRRTAQYRAFVRVTAQCLAAASNVETVSVPPVVTVVQSSTRLIGRTVRFQLRCPVGGVCSGTVKLRTASAVGPSGSRRRVTLGAKAFQIPGNGRRLTRITVSPRVRSALRTRSRVMLNVFVTSRGPDGRTGFNRDRLVLRTR